MFQVRREWLDLVRELVYERKPTAEMEDTEPQCVVDVLWHKILFEKDDSFQESILTENISDVLIAGQETVVQTMCWILLTFLNYPDMEKKVAEELQREFPDPGALVPNSASGLCNYTNAFISEVLRRTPISFSTADHAALEDVENFHGYRIPKGYKMFPNLMDLNFDKTVWKNPEAFSPENFLDDSGKYRSNPYLFSFGAGPRKCVGEVLARTEMFVVISNLVKRYHISPGSIPLPNLDPVFQFMLNPQPFDVVVNKRSSQRE